MNYSDTPSISMTALEQDDWGCSETVTRTSTGVRSRIGSRQSTVVPSSNLAHSVAPSQSIPPSVHGLGCDSKAPQRAPEDVLLDMLDGSSALAGLDEDKRHALESILRSGQEHHKPEPAIPVPDSDMDWGREMMREQSMGESVFIDTRMPQADDTAVGYIVPGGTHGLVQKPDMVWGHTNADDYAEPEIQMRSMTKMRQVQGAHGSFLNVAQTENKFVTLTPSRTDHMMFSARAGTRRGMSADALTAAFARTRTRQDCKVVQDPEVAEEELYLGDTLM